MSYNGSGTFNINTAGQPVVTGTVISSSVFNALTADLATGLSTAITKDGQTTITNNIPFNGYKITNLGAGTASTDAVRLGQLQAGTATSITVTGTDTYTGTMSPALASYTAGNTFSFVVPNTNTTGCTLNIDGQGAKAITRDGSTALIAGDLVAGSEVVVIYDGTRFQVLNSNSKTNWTVSNALTLSSGTANGVAYLNGSKALTTGSALTFDGTNLGIGTSSPSYKLDVGNGSAQVVARINSVGGSGAGPYLRFDKASVQKNLIGSYSAIISGTSDDLTYWSTTGAGHQWVVNNNGSSSMTLDSSGNLGLGVTPSAWFSAAKAFQIGSRTAIYQDSANNGVFSYNNYQDGAGNKYLANAYASLYALLNNGQHAWFTAPSGTAGNAISFTQAMTLDASGNLGVGTTSPGSFAGTVKLVVGSAATTTTPGAVTVYSGTATYGGLYFADGTVGDQLYRGAVEYNHSTDALLLYSAGAERARIDSSGYLQVAGTGGTALINANANTGGINSIGLYQSVAGGYCIYTSTANNGGTYYHAQFTEGGTGRGSITSNGSNVSYNTSSDYRLKDKQQALTGSGAFIDALKPKTWEWKTDGSKGVGFIAHEVAEVSPASVVGEKDAVDADGKPVYQAMEYGSAEFIANIVAELQSLRARVAQLESK